MLFSLSRSSSSMHFNWPSPHFKLHILRMFLSSLQFFKCQSCKLPRTLQFIADLPSANTLKVWNNNALSACLTNINKNYATKLNRDFCCVNFSGKDRRHCTTSLRSHVNCISFSFRSSTTLIIDGLAILLMKCKCLVFMLLIALKWLAIYVSQGTLLFSYGFLVNERWCSVININWVHKQ